MFRNVSFSEYCIYPARIPSSDDKLARDECPANMRAHMDSCMPRALHCLSPMPLKQFTFRSEAKVLSSMANQTATETATQENTKFEEVYCYLLNGEYPLNCTKSGKLVIRRRAKDYKIIDAQLHYTAHMKGCDEDPTKSVSPFTSAIIIIVLVQPNCAALTCLTPFIQPRLVINDKCEQQRIMRVIHEQGHLGRDKFISQVGSGYYWKSLCSDFVEIVSYLL